MAAKRKKKPPKHRASWRGNLTFGLVSFPVQAVNALNRQQSDIHFHQLHATCHRRIHYQKVCPVHGEVPNDEIVSGFEYRKGKYIEIESDELDAVRTKKERALTIDAFVDPATIDLVYFDGRMYYLLPDGAASQEPYAIIAEAMERAACWGVGQIVFSGKDQIVAVRPFDGRLHMAMLNYDEEIKSPAEVLPKPKRPAGAAKQVKLAQTLINEKKGHEVVEAKEEEEEPEVINLLEALKQSVEQAKSGSSRKKTRKRKRSA
jgi:DNA end-binding protein Ku